MKSLDEQVREALRNVPRAYDDFVNGLTGEFRGKPEKQKELLKFLKEHPTAKSDEVLMQIVDVILPEIMDDEDEDEETEDEDSFYSEINMRAIEESEHQYQEGKVVVKTMEELEAMENS